MKLNAVFRQRWWLLYIPILVTACLLFWLCATLWTPLPPKRLSLAVNEEDVEIALKYRQRLEQRGIQMRLVKTSGDSGALQAVAARNADPAADAGFALGLLNTPGDAPVYSLGAVERQPVWIFSRLSGLHNLGQMRWAFFSGITRRHCKGFRSGAKTRPNWPGCCWMASWMWWCW